MQELKSQRTKSFKFSGKACLPIPYITMAKVALTLELQCYSPKCHDSLPLVKKFQSSLNLGYCFGIDAEMRNQISIVKNFFVAVEGGHRAVIFDRFQGVKPDVTGEGTHFLIPWVQRPIIFDIRSRPRNVPVITGSKGK